MEMVFTGRPFTAKEMYDCNFVNAVVPFDELEAMTQKYALACARSRPTDTVFVQKTFFEIFKQHQGEYMGSIISGLLESTGRHAAARRRVARAQPRNARPRPDELGPRQRRAVPARLAPEPPRAGGRVASDAPVCVPTTGDLVQVRSSATTGRRSDEGGVTMLVLTNAQVFDGREMLPGRHSVTIDGDRIVAIDEAPDEVSGEVVDVAGMTLMPGLITCHLHPDFYKFDIFSGEKPGKELPPGVMMAIGVRTCRVLLESGFTGYVGAGLCARRRRPAQDGHRPGDRPGPAHPRVRPPHRHHW
jgi:hypothetical protein